MTLTRFIFAAALLSGSSLVNAQDCGTTDTGACDWDPYNPVACGVDFACGYANFCLARENGFDLDNDCCQAPQPSSCPFLSDPHLCGTKQCPYANLCLANLAGYSDDQCEPEPEQCPVGTDDCSGEPSNPFKCGAAKSCPYETICDARSAGWNVAIDCCQDTRTDTACTFDISPVSCGPPQKQCPYDNQCLANAAGYTEMQCCLGVPEGTICTAISAPVECGSMPCKYPSQCQASAAGYGEAECCAVPGEDVACTFEIAPVQCGSNSCEYSSQCLANAAGYTEMDCCPAPDAEVFCTAEFDPHQCGPNQCEYSNLCQANAAGYATADCCPAPQGACTTENDPVLCAETCNYGSQSCADAAGFTSDQCCNQPRDLSSCPFLYDPLACSTANCIYDNACIAELAGFDPNSCVKLPPSALASTNGGANGTQSEVPASAETIPPADIGVDQTSDQTSAPGTLQSSSAGIVSLIMPFCATSLMALFAFVTI